MDSDFEIRIGDLDHQSVRELLARHETHCLSDTVPEKAHRLDIDALRAPEIVFFVLWQNGEAVGMAALRDLGDGLGELKSMHIRLENRGAGLADQLLDHVLNYAARAGFQRIGLETGDSASFEAARAFYKRHGFAPCPPFGHYCDAPHGICMMREIGDASD